MIARFLGVKIWELKNVATHYQEEAITILAARYNAITESAKSAKCSAEKIILPDF